MSMKVGSLQFTVALLPPITLEYGAHRFLIVLLASLNTSIVLWYGTSAHTIMNVYICLKLVEEVKL